MLLLPFAKGKRSSVFISVRERKLLAPDYPVRLFPLPVGRPHRTASDLFYRVSQHIKAAETQVVPSEETWFTECTVPTVCAVCVSFLLSRGLCVCHRTVPAFP